jgi:hypothetical protein
LSTNPPPGVSNVPVNAAIVLQTNAEIDLTTVNGNSFQIHDNTTGQNAAGTYSLSADAMTVYFVPNAPLATGRNYSVNFVNSGITDVLGNPLTCCGVNNFSFTTGVAPSTTGPQVTGVSPGDGLTQVPINTRVMIQFNEPVDTQTLGQVTLSAAGVPVNVILSLTNGNQTLVLVPVVPLAANTAYTLNVTGVADLSGVQLIDPPVTTTFTTGPGVDFSAPQVSSVSPNNGATAVPTNTTVQLQFNEVINPLTITNSSFTISIGGGNPITGSIVVAPDGRSATLTPGAALAPATTYTVRATVAITDLAGQGLGSFQSSFTTTSQ